MEVYLYADVTLLLSVVVCVPMLWSVARVYKIRFRLYRAILASCVCAAFTIASISLKISYLWMMLVSAASFIGMIFVAFGKLNRHTLAGAVIMLASEMIFVSGAAVFLNTAFSSAEKGYVSIWCAVLGVLFLVIAFRLKREARLDNGQYVTIEITIKGEMLCIDAMMDSGNLLVEPISLLPVIVLSSKLLKRDRYKLLQSEKGARFVPVKTVNGQSLLACHHAEKVRVKNGNLWSERGEAYVGISDNLICDALVGPEI